MTNAADVALPKREHHVVSTYHEGKVSFIAINNPPVNALSREVRAGLISAIGELCDRPETQAIVLLGANDTFIAGADLKEFGQPLSSPTLPQVILAIEESKKPVVAAIFGPALGGGLEVALACDGRVARLNAVVGLPEGTFGIIPGSGGTVRLPRLTDAAKALEIISTCRRVTASEALSLGIIDAVVDNLDEVAQFALSLDGQKRRLRDAVAKPTDANEWKLAAAKALKRGRNRPFAFAQVEAIQRALVEPFDAALAAERARFEELRDSDESAALRHLFFAERAATRLDGLEGLKTSTLQKIGIVGAGTMGCGIATAFMAAGLHVTLIDSSADALGAAREKISGLVNGSTKAGALDVGTDIALLAGCDLVLEAVFEDMTVKRDLLRKLEGMVKAETILASNTSYLNLDMMASAVQHPERVIGLHFFAPAHLMKLLEIVRGSKTDQSVLKTTLSLGRLLGKIAIVSGVGEGFIGNRIYNAYRVQCEAMVLEGALPDQVDDALQALGFAMGPFQVSDLSGLDIAWANRQRKQSETGDFSDVPVLEWLVKSGRLGRKTDAGWHRYENGAKVTDSEVTALVEKARRERGVMPRQLSQGEIQNRALGAIVNEGLLVLQDGIAARASDIDLALVHGYGFPKHLGGPLYWAARQDRDFLETTLTQVAGQKRHGDVSILSRAQSN
ncbi:3-hydroxyacyl-CoA dehydrogenase NAD-binding domain-containing protein [Pararhizobium sp. YC-54]|uniref:3-hydroxyacyl-CoA dehydrogenase NAD-binding domain-containing protein n=1 Tax=Pararhizobium sp. YC-54 TaxID=2986920 RepID=UPI0021F6A368|nr:3-hydroxyacyl-CoA dehydrogenase NAD-binding domain-containing protein [Pararhizobium sp. YC-54]MCW0001577.1 3-hydroxyacyl-CoA dehydrogenase NAD-binding domain-containing protein [Pararhizobium sp. YC-54]